MYGLSSVNFESDKVIAWSNSNGNLKAKLKSKINSKYIGYFTVGSTKDEVLSLQGQPTGVYKSFWRYGNSSVIFESNKVVSWSNSEGNLKANLKSKLLIVDEEDKGDLKLEKISTKGYFQLGSTTA